MANPDYIVECDNLVKIYILKCWPCRDWSSASAGAS